MMSVHKFGQKPIHWYKSRRQPRTIYWIPKMGSISVRYLLRYVGDKL